MLKIAISQDIQILKDFENQLVNSGIDIDFHDNSKQLLFSRDFPAEIRYLNKNHLFFSLTNGMQDLAIVHEHFLTDQRKEYERIYSFDSTKTNLSVFVPSNMRYKDVFSFSNKRIATNVPDLVRAYFKEKRLRGINIIADDNPQSAVDVSIAEIGRAHV